jgi:3-phytase
MDVYGSGLYQSAQDGAFYFFVGSKTGEVRQFLLRGNDEGKVEAEMVRTLKLATQVEGIVADDDLGYLFAGEEGRGVWRFGAEPADAPEGMLISAIGRDQPLRRADIEGLAIYKSSATEVYLIASSQGSNEYVIFQRGEPHGYVGTFRIAAGDSIDAVEETDGIDVTSLSLGPEFPGGVFVAQDGRNPRGSQNFKIVPWHRIAEAFNPPLASSGR